MRSHTGKKYEGTLQPVDNIQGELTTAPPTGKVISSSELDSSGNQCASSQEATMSERLTLQTLNLPECVGGSIAGPSSASNFYNSSLSFHCFPKDISLSSKWLKIIRGFHHH
ncbi:hypothetical protein NQD34_016540 [Periophthalmus magnuspinnatus]|nr:hypothetical protein NQD34_016540 [Periophthalmus magnuspinnatus]